MKFSNPSPTFIHHSVYKNVNISRAQVKEICSNEQIILGYTAVVWDRTKKSWTFLAHETLNKIKFEISILVAN